LEYAYNLRCTFAADDRDPDALVERLGDADCQDTLVGIRQFGTLTLKFARAAESAGSARMSAKEAVRRAVPSARLIEAARGISDVQPETFGPRPLV